MSGLYNFLVTGGIWMWPIMLAQVVSFALIGERIVALYMRRSGNLKSRVRQYEEEIKKGNLDKVVSRTSVSSTDALSSIVKSGAQSVLQGAGKEEIQLKMDELVMEETSRIEKRIGFLATIANVATLMGLLATIMGLIHSFTSISAASGAEKAKILSDGISEAMNGTAYGLVVEVPALIAYAILQSRANALTEDLNKATLRLYIWFGFNVETPVKSKRA